MGNGEGMEEEESVLLPSAWLAPWMGLYEGGKSFETVMLVCGEVIARLES